jgi:hypothetical protein
LANSGIKILTVNGLAFKDLNKNGQLDKYEDWQLAVDVRAKYLASKLSIEQIAGLMLYSGHQSSPARAGGYFAGTYNGKPYTAGETDASDMTDQQQKFLETDNLSHVLIPEVAAKWNNKMQAIAKAAFPQNKLGGNHNTEINKSAAGFTSGNLIFASSLSKPLSSRLLFVALVAWLPFR